MRTSSIAPAALSPTWAVLGFLTPWLFPFALPVSLVWVILLLVGVCGIVTAWQPRAKVISLPIVLYAGSLSWTILVVNNALEQRLDPQPGRPAQVVSGVVIGLPSEYADMTRFDLLARGLDPRQPHRNTRIQVSWYDNAPNIKPGQAWSLPLRLKPTRGRLNFAGADTERALFAQGYAALATVAETPRFRPEVPVRPGAATLIDQLRAEIRERISLALAGHPGKGLVLALALADRSALDNQVREQIRATGTGHLLAISGMHIGLVALMGYWLARVLVGLTSPLVCWQRPHHWAVLCGLCTAICYASLAGLGTSTQRALVMLTVLAACLLTRRLVSPWRAWVLAMALVLALDPLTALTAGFWLSFGAVAALIFAFAPLAQPPGSLHSLLRAQWAIGLLMAPMGAFWFQQWAPGGFLVNLAAIPWVSAITLPLVFASLLSLFLSNGLTDSLLGMAADSAGWLQAGIRWGAGLSGDMPVSLASPGVLVVLSAMTAGALLLCQQFSANRLTKALLCLALVLPISWPATTGPRYGEATLELLDVGQGLSALVHTQRHTLIYDTGPGMPGQWNLDARVIAPALLAAGRGKPDRVLVSHGDLDHAGAREVLENRLGPGRLFANRRSGQDCTDRLAWAWDGVAFNVLHPSRWLPYLGNDSSCVLSVRTSGSAILLPGDIGSRVEHRLADSHGGGFDIVVVAHHGSHTSSSREFLNWARPEIALVANGHDNRFGFPHTEVLTRLAASGSATWSTAECGAVRLDIDADGAISAISARRARSAAWRWAAAANCP